MDRDEIKLMVAEKFAEVEALFGEDQAFFYQAGFLDAVDVMFNLAQKVDEQQSMEQSLGLFNAFSRSPFPQSTRTS